MNVTISGTNTKIRTNTTTPPINGRASLMYSSIGTFIIEVVVYIVTPTGGVMPPNVTIVIIKIPKCTGSTPTCVTIGRKIGVNSKTNTVDSMNIPAMTRNSKINSSINVPLLVMPIRKSAAFCGRRSYVIKNPKMDDVEMIKRMDALSVTDCSMDSIKFFQFNSL